MFLCCYKSPQIKENPRFKPFEEFIQQRKIHNACKNIIMSLAGVLGDSRPHLAITVSEALKEANNTCLNMETATDNISNPKDRIKQFKLNTTQGIYAQNFWVTVSKEIAKTISHFIIYSS